jgi:AmpD protein
LFTDPPSSPRLELNRDGVIEAGAIQIASPNCDDRPDGESITLIVIHSISLPPGEFGGDAIAALFTNTLDCAAHPYYDSLRNIRVSAHFLIQRAGDVVQFVPCGRRAWHAGVSCYAGRERCNDFSVGIELEGAEGVAYTEPQYKMLAVLVEALRARYPITDIVGHSDIAPGRKTDPGPSFDWQRLHTALRRG